jgi:uncharacterized membrane protein YqhA
MGITLAILTAVALFMFIILLGLYCLFVLRKILNDMTEEELEELNKTLLEDKSTII